jgi:hypothetical protein
MPSKAILILRSARRARLEGRVSKDASRRTRLEGRVSKDASRRTRLEGRKGVPPPSSQFFPSLNALFDLLRRARRHIGEERS